MIHSIIKWTLWQYRTSIIGWSAGISSFIFINLALYPSFRDQSAALNKAFENLPQTAVQLLGGSSDFLSPIGFLNSKVFFLMLPLMLSIFAINLGSSLIAKEEQDKTIEALLARPISRTKLLFAKAGAGVIIVSLVMLAGLTTTVLLSAIVNLGIPIGHILLVGLACLLMVLCSGAIGFMLAAVGMSRGASVGIATVIALGGYLFSSLSSTVTWLAEPSKLLPFHYYHSEAILRGTFDETPMLFFIGVTAVCLLVAWQRFCRRDIA